MRHWLTALSRQSDSGVSSKASAADKPATDEQGARDALDRILRSSDFDATPRSRQLLVYVVEETLKGRTERIKAFSIATDVFGRDSNFDAHSDPIVRLEASRLRRSLTQYYSLSGRDDPISIAIAKGGYIPTFEARPGVAPEPRLPQSRYLPIAGAIFLAASAAGIAAVLLVEPAHRLSPTGPAVPRLFVQPFDDLTGNEGSTAIAKGLTQETISQVAKFKDIVAIDGGRPEAAREKTRYILFGAVSTHENRLRLQTRVLKVEDSAVLWAQTYEVNFEPSAVMAMEQDIARQIATSIGQPYGVIYKADIEKNMRVGPDDWTAYLCTLSYYAYRANLDGKSHPRIRECLEGAVARFPNYATAWALLAQTYLDELRFGYSVAASTSAASLDRVMHAANRAVDLDPQNVRALQSKMLALYFDEQIEAALAVGERALGMNPNDTELMGEYGARLADSGQWETGCRLIAQALDRNPGPSGYFETVLAICAYVDEDYKTAAKLVKKAAVMDNPAYHLVAAAIFAESGQTEDAEVARQWLMRHAPAFVANARKWAGFRNVRPVDRDRFIASLRRARLPIED